MAYQGLAPPTQTELASLAEINLLHDRDSDLSLSVLVDGGAAGSTCHDASCLHGYKLLTRDKYFNDVGKTHTRVLVKGIFVWPRQFKGSQSIS
jgi:hypothetical protein